jgi:hypothetical protein
VERDGGSGERGTYADESDFAAGGGLGGHFGYWLSMERRKGDVN